MQLQISMCSIPSVNRGFSELAYAHRAMVVHCMCAALGAALGLWHPRASPEGFGWVRVGVNMVGNSHLGTLGGSKAAVPHWCE